jgi:hypothetical protein
MKNLINEWKEMWKENNDLFIMLGIVVAALIVITILKIIP